MASQDPHDEWTRKAWLAFALVSLAIVITLLNFLPGCGVKPKATVVQPAPGSGSGSGSEAADCGDLAIGETREQACATGQTGTKLMVCSKDGLKTAVDTCVAGNQCGQLQALASGTDKTFVDVKPIIEAKCVSCHSSPKNFGDYDVAQGLASEMVRRINLPADSHDRMPRTPNPELTRAEKDTFQHWLDGGTLEKPNPCGNGTGSDASGFVDLDYVETAMLLDLNRVSAVDRPFTRYLTTAHRANIGATPEEMETSRQAVDKTLNSISTTDDITRAAPIDPKGVVYRVDLRSFGIDQAEWALIEQNDKLKVESLTNKGVLIKTLTGTKQPMFHFDNFTDVVMRNSALYYTLMGISADFNTEMTNLGVDFKGELQRLEPMAVGFNGSRISNQKNRLVLRSESSDGYVWTTFDTIPADPIAARNLFDFPLLADTGGTKVYTFDAGETIFTMPNGMQGYALYNAAGVRQDNAPPNIVRDTDSPVAIAGQINNADSCSRCHNMGLVSTADQVRSHVIQNASQFTVGDVEKVKQLYREAPAVAAQFAQDNGRFKQALDQLGVDPTAPDPMNVETDKLRLDWNVDQVAALVFMKTEDFKTALNQSAQGREQVGQLLDGGTITFDQLIQILPILKVDLRLFQDPLGQ